MPLVVNLRMDPFERMIEEGGGYSRWWGEKLWTLMPATVIVGQFLETFKEYPPSQPTGSTKVEGALQALQAGSAGGGQQRAAGMNRLRHQSSESPDENERTEKRFGQ